MVVAQLLDALDETFEQVHGIYLDKGTSLFETLATITAEQASQPVGGRCASLAAQVAHVDLYLGVIEHYMLSDERLEVNWKEIWLTVMAVTPEQWAGLIQQLRDTYQRVLGTMRSFESWDHEDKFGGALAMLIHTAYHLGEIRQALCVLQRDV